MDSNFNISRNNLVVSAYYLRFDVERLRCCALDVEEVVERAEAGEHDA